jgi:hypothetical protein
VHILLEVAVLAGVEIAGVVVKVLEIMPPN